MRITIHALAAALSMSLAAAAFGQDAGPAAPPTKAPIHHLDGCPKNIADFDNSDATRKLVEKCMGRPASVAKGRGDDVIYHYSARGGTIMILFVFDSSGALTHFAAYQQQ
jgi:hypothetical protein